MCAPDPSPQAVLRRKSQSSSKAEPPEKANAPPCATLLRTALVDALAKNRQRSTRTVELSANNAPPETFLSVAESALARLLVKTQSSKVRPEPLTWSAPPRWSMMLPSVSVRPLRTVFVTLAIYISRMLLAGLRVMVVGHCAGSRAPGSTPDAS